MVLQTSGAISIAQMRDEYQLGNPISMNQFYGKPGIQGSGVISFGDFYGKSNFTAYLTPGDQITSGNTTSKALNTTLVASGGNVVNLTWTLSNVKMSCSIQSTGTWNCNVNLNAMGFNNTASCTLTATFSSGGIQYTRSCFLSYKANNPF